MIDRKFSRFLYLLYRDSEERRELRTINMAFSETKRMIYDLLNTGLPASCMQKAERHNSIED